MIKARGKAALAQARFRYVTALTDRQVRQLLRQGVPPRELFDETPVEVRVGTKRYVLRRYPAARTEVMDVPPKFPAPVLSLATPVRWRLKKACQQSAAQ